MSSSVSASQDMSGSYYKPHQAPLPNSLYPESPWVSLIKVADCCPNQTCFTAHTHMLSTISILDIPAVTHSLVGWQGPWRGCPHHSIHSLHRVWRGQRSQWNTNINPEWHISLNSHDLGGCTFYQNGCIHSLYRVWKPKVTMEYTSILFHVFLWHVTNINPEGHCQFKLPWFGKPMVASSATSASVVWMNWINFMYQCYVLSCAICY